MPLLDHDPSTTDCPECGNPMPMVSWIGRKPVCNRCANNTTRDWGW